MVLKFWKKQETFKKTTELNKDGPEYVFYEGPPSANGMPGIHHVMARAIKDIFCRYKTLKGFYVKRKAGLSSKVVRNNSFLITVAE